MQFYLSPVLQGIVVANVISFAILGLSVQLQIWESGVLIFSEFVILPFLMGLIFAWFCRKTPMKSKSLTGYAVLNGLVAILLSFILLGEGMICLLIVSPLIFGFVVTGTFVGRRLFKKASQTLNVCVFSILFVVFITDSLSDHHHENLVSDEMIIEASPAEIWQNVVAFDKIEQKMSIGFLKLGCQAPWRPPLTAITKVLAVNAYSVTDTSLMNVL